ncbi:MAG: type 1 glutamine amidotransferase [Rhizobiales bacterium]|nr:type 1 glutamine amidotransferase [Hyphomicrobiales bacterium]
MPRALVFQHMFDDDLCYFDELLRADGFSIDTVHLYDGQAVPALADYDLMMVLGGAMDAWQTDEHPWLIGEQDAIREWVDGRAKPFIGICLGHQLLATSLGGSVGQASATEVGLNHMRIDPESDHEFFAGLSGEYPVMQWHHAEIKDVPDGAHVLASSAMTEVQALAVGDHALGVQFHFEWTLDRVRSWPEGWLEALNKELGEGAHGRVIADATPHMAGINQMARTIWGNFKRVNRL